MQDDLALNIEIRGLKKVENSILTFKFKSKWKACLVFELTELF